MRAEPDRELERHERDRGEDRDECGAPLRAQSSSRGHTSRSSAAAKSSCGSPSSATGEIVSASISAVRELESRPPLMQVGAIEAAAVGRVEAVALGEEVVERPGLRQELARRPPE